MLHLVLRMWGKVGRKNKKREDYQLCWGKKFRHLSLGTGAGGRGGQGVNRPPPIVKKKFLSKKIFIIMFPLSPPPKQKSNKNILYPTTPHKKLLENKCKMNKQNKKVQKNRDSRESI